MTYKRHQQYQPLCLHSLTHVTHASPDMSESESNSLAFNSDLVPKKGNYKSSGLQQSTLPYKIYTNTVPAKPITTLFQHFRQKYTTDYN